jgi:hypothetical protein
LLKVMFERNGKEKAQTFARMRALSTRQQLWSLQEAGGAQLLDHGNRVLNRSMWREASLRLGSLTIKR